MKVTFLAQGFEPESINSVGNKVFDLLDDNSYSEVFIMSAFASEAAVELLKSKISNSSRSKESYSIIVGVDQEGTSKEALGVLLSLKIKSYVFYQKESPIFHPKIYIFCGEEKNVVIVGSSNLTSQGLFTNIESSLMIEFDSSDLDGINLLNSIKKYYSSLFDYSDPNLFSLSQELIDDFIKKGIIPEQKKWQKRYGKHSADLEDSGTDEGIVIPKRSCARAQKILRGKDRNDVVVSKLILEAELSQSEELADTEVETLLWESNPLSRRDLNIPPENATTTHPTGSMTLTKGKWDIDQREYFYGVAFKDLNWSKDSNRPNLVKAECEADIFIDDIYKGTFKLGITHNISKTSRTYLQNNAVTHLKWHDAKKIISRDYLLGKTLYLLKNHKTGNYVIKIK